MKLEEAAKKVEKRLLAEQLPPEKVKKFVEEFKNLNSGLEVRFYDRWVDWKVEQGKKVLI